MTDALHTTTDPYLASFLLSQQAELVGGRRTGPKRVEFFFRADRRLHALLRLYWSGREVPISPAALMACLRTLKARSFTGR